MRSVSLETFPIFDVAFRHQQALDPSALTTIPTTIHAIEKAIEDCRRAGLDANSDPAIVLLARHLSTICAARPDNEILRGACTDRVAALRRFPPLVALANRGVAYDAVGKKRFHIDGRKALRRLAAELHLAPDGYDLHSNPGDASASGEIVPRAPDLYVQMSIGRLSQGREILYRHPRTITRIVHGHTHYAGMREIMAPERLAERISRDLKLPVPVDMLTLLSA